MKKTYLFESFEYRHTHVVMQSPIFMYRKVLPLSELILKSNIIHRIRGLINVE